MVALLQDLNKKKIHNLHSFSAIAFLQYTKKYLKYSLDIFLYNSMKKICIVEDDFGISTSLKLYLENSDFEVDIYES